VDSQYGIGVQASGSMAGPEPADEPLPLPFSLDQLHNLGIAQRPPGRASAARLVVGGGGDLDAVLVQHATDRLDPVLRLVVVNVVDQYR